MKASSTCQHLHVRKRHFLESGKIFVHANSQFVVISVLLHTSVLVSVNRKTGKLSFRLNVKIFKVSFHGFSEKFPCVKKTRKRLCPDHEDALFRNTLPLMKPSTIDTGMLFPWKTSKSRSRFSPI